MEIQTDAGMAAILLLQAVVYNPVIALHKPNLLLTENVSNYSQVAGRSVLLLFVITPLVITLE